MQRRGTGRRNGEAEDSADYLSGAVRESRNPVSLKIGFFSADSDQMSSSLFVPPPASTGSKGESSRPVTAPRAAAAWTA